MSTAEETPLGSAVPLTSVNPADVRCRHCGRLLFRAVIARGCWLEIRCPKCGQMRVIDMLTPLPPPPPTERRNGSQVDKQTDAVLG